MPTCAFFGKSDSFIVQIEAGEQGRTAQGRGTRGEKEAVQDERFSVATGPDSEPDSKVARADSRRQPARKDTPRVRFNRLNSREEAYAVILHGQICARGTQ